MTSATPPTSANAPSRVSTEGEEPVSASSPLWVAPVLVPPSDEPDAAEDAGASSEPEGAVDAAGPEVAAAPAGLSPDGALPGEDGAVVGVAVAGDELLVPAVVGGVEVGPAVVGDAEVGAAVVGVAVVGVAVVGVAVVAVAEVDVEAGMVGVGPGGG
ncbi:MAG: hypothetical protein KDB24_12935 [Microthrixaceae bacterium]|nr:hypothetical protein [Microthrixaceae bacterium]